MIERLLSEALEKRFQEEDLKDCFLVDIVTKKDSKVEVYIDSDSSLSLDTCRIVSRYLENLIEENNWLGEKYTLEVSSPGLDRPLSLLRQYVKNIGRKIRVTKEDGSKIEGKLTAATPDKIEVEINSTKETSIKFDDIKTAKILVSFK